ncbi:hypothetical protein IT400_00765 [Candidatus Nomurabacteria bacterium]|nr:hypothetical protein [Candidatus Nomurabacteria bacterium]
MYLNKIQNFFKYLIFYSFLVFPVYTIQAADLSMTPQSGSVEVGDTIKMRVVLSSSDKLANAVSGTVTFSKDLLTLSSISKSDSIVNVWPVDPSFSNASGTLNLDGVILSGYQGTNGTILTLFFKAKAVGNATIKFENASILAHDGAGTQILNNTKGSNFNITEAKTRTIESTPKTIKIKTTEKVAIDNVPIPIFTDYSNNVRENDFIVIKGTSLPFYDVIFNLDAQLLDGNNFLHESSTIKADERGRFTYVSDSRARKGVYTIVARARNTKGIEGIDTNPLQITVQEEAKLVVTKATNIFLFMIPIILLFIMLIILYGWYRVMYCRNHPTCKLFGPCTYRADNVDKLN